MMKKWEYEMENLSRAASRDNIMNRINKMGKRGWEMCGASTTDTNVMFYFKREKTNQNLGNWSENKK